MLFLVAFIAILVIFKLAVSSYEKNLLFFPTRDHRATPEQVGLPMVDPVLASDDGTRLGAWWIPSDSAPVAVLVLHGNGGNIGDRLHLALGFHRLGWSSFLLDYRGYGTSEGSPELPGMCRDAEAAWAWIAARGYEPGRIIIFGESLGGSVAAWLAERHPDCRGLVLDGTFTSMGEMSRRVLGGFSAAWFLSTNMDTRRRLEKLDVPVIILHGDRDPVIPFRMGQELFAAAAGRKAFVPVAGGEHCNLPDLLGPAYFDAIRNFHAGGEADTR